MIFHNNKPRTRLRTTWAILELIFHATVRHLRKTHRNAVVGLVMNVVQALVMVLIFYVMMNLLGLRNAAIRGDYLLYLMSGIFLYMTFVRSMSAVVKSDGPTSAMMQHAPMNTIVAILSSALSTLYIQILSIFVILFAYHVGINRIEIDDPIGALGMIVMAWFCGLSIGTMFLAASPWFPGFVGILNTVFARANMIASGKMFVANTLSASMLAIFDWNPLFHIIDQTRGFVFLNYNPHNSSLIYPFYVGLACLAIGLMGEFFTRRHVSISWYATR